LSTQQSRPCRRLPAIGILALAAWLGACALPASAQSGAAGSTAATPQATGAAPPQSPQAAAPEAVLLVNNRPIVSFRATVLGAPPRQRAEASQVRIRQALQEDGPGQVSTTRIGDTVRFAIDGKTAFFLTVGDIGESLTSVPDDAIEAVSRRLQYAIDEARQARDPAHLAKAAAYAIGATVLALLLVRLLFRIRRKVEARLDARLHQWVARLQQLGKGELHAEQVIAGLHATTTVITWALTLVVLNTWLSFALQQFAYTRHWGETLTGWLLGVLADFALAIVYAIPGLAIAVLVFLFARFVVRMNTVIMQRAERGELQFGWLDADTAGPTRRIGNFVVWLFALVMAYPYLPGSNTEAFKGVSVLIGLMVSLGASNIIGQAMSGLSLMYRRSLRVGEYVRIGDTEGTVVAIGMFGTRLHTGMGEEVTLPNTAIVGSTVRNFSRLAADGAFVLHTAVTIGYATPWRQVHAMLLEAARRTPGVAQDPAPYVVQTALSDFYVEYRLCAQGNRSAPRRRADAMSALHANIQDVFNEYGVQIMSPHYLSDPPEPQVVPPARWYSAPAAAAGPAEAPTPAGDPATSQAAPATGTDRRS